MEFSHLRTSTVLNTITLPVDQLNGLTFGGPQHDILFVLAAGDVEDLTTSQLIGQVTNGSSLYMITGLGAMGPDLSRFVI